MTSLTGMDVGAVRDLAGRLDAQAQHLEDVLRRITALVRHGRQVWHGPSVERFAAQWSGHQTALRRLVADLQEAADRLRSNTDDQQATSGGSAGAAGSAAATVGVPSSAGSAFFDAVGHAGPAFASAAGGVFAGASFASHVARGLPSAALNGRLGGLLRGATWVDHAPAVGVYGHVSSTLGVVEHSAQMLAAADQGDLGEAAYQGAQATGAALRDLPGPIPYLVGVNVSIWSDVVKEGSKIEWDEPLLPMPPHAWETIYRPAFADTGRQFLNLTRDWF
jgi:WXG100 family type VII secretion target